ncbi:MAG: hypothetical protein H8D38_04740 [DPANN group archaeon]|nr:hypothetical protein [DPANN group archaeon]
MTLKEWTVHFVKNKDLLQKKLVSFEEKDDLIVFHFKNVDKEYLLVENLNESVLSFVKHPGFKNVVCSAKKENLKFLIDNWTELKKIENLSFVFVNVRNNACWIINSFVHNKICDDSSLVLGLKSMYSNTFQAQDY